MNHFEQGQASKENEIVYTEDGVPVYTLYLSKIPKSQNENDIKEYFSSFGNIESVMVVRENQQNSERMCFQHGFVTFTEPEGAARALNHPKHLHLKSFTVKPAREQPNNAGTSLLDLNDDCLHHVFSFLSENEVLKVTFVCKRFNNLSKQKILSRKLIDLNEIFEETTLAEATQFLSAFGEYIRRLGFRKEIWRSDNRRPEFLELIPKFCHNLMEIESDFLRDIPSDTYKRIFQSSKHLKSLTLHDCDLTDDLCSLISECTELESLDLSNNKKITGKHLKLLKSLKRLNICNCENIDSTYFIELCQAVKLKELKVVGCYLGDEELDALVATQTDLNWLTISRSTLESRMEVIEKINSLKHVQMHGDDAWIFNPEVLCEMSAQRQGSLETLELYNLWKTDLEVNCKPILQLKNLKKLCMVRDQYLTDEFLGEIVQNCRMLESLNIAGASHLVTDTGVLNVIENLQNLKFLNISHCNRFGHLMIHEICSALEKRENKVELPLTLCVYDTQFDREKWRLIKDPKIRKLVTLSFEKDSLYKDYCDDEMDLYDDRFSYFDSEDDSSEYSYDSYESSD